jgi:hypothetical protein
MKITRRNPFTGQLVEWEIAVTAQQLVEWEKGALIQDAMSNLTDDEREFILSGITPDQWDQVFGKT